MGIPKHPFASTHIDDTLFLLQESLTDDSNDPRLNVAWQWKLQGYAEVIQFARECVDDSKPANLHAVP